MNLIANKQNIIIISILVGACLLGAVFFDGLDNMVGRWNSDEYSHGYFIPLIALWMAWENRVRLAEISEYSWAGPLLVLAGLVLGIIGELATLFVITQYAFLLTLFGLCLAFIGWQGVRLLWFPLVYLLFMIPLPNFLYSNLSSYLQLISSSLGVSVIRFCDISVFLQGNVIDLGNYQLQVVEACSGLRYLFPLASFGFLCAYFFKGKWWMRAVLFLSTLPITVLMNSFRIGVIGVLVDNWGIEQAEGFLHDFEGWVIFIGCLGVLFFEMWLLVKFFYKGQAFSDIFVIGVDEESTAQNKAHIHQEPTKESLPKSYIVSLILLILVTPLAIFVGDRVEVVPDRTRFSYFPLQVAEWRGIETSMEQQFIDALKFDDYITANYSQPESALSINFYVAYYASQRKGASVHSPKSCMPGDGWRISGARKKQIAGVVSKSGQALFVNRVLISKGEHKQLVYYWFQQRGRVMTNEYLVKWYLFWDALTRSRTDGALVRLVVSVSNAASVATAERQMDAYLAEVFPLLNKFVPD